MNPVPPTLLEKYNRILAIARSHPSGQNYIPTLSYDKVAGYSINNPFGWGSRVK